MKKLIVVAVLATVGALMAPAVAQAAFGIDPGKVYVDNLSPGANGQYSITLVNQNDREAKFSATPRLPDYTQTGYETFNNLDWISIEPAQQTIPGNGKAQFQVTVTMPKDSVYFGKRAEAWISFRELDTPGMIKIEIASRLFITTRSAEDVANLNNPTSAVSNGASELSGAKSSGANWWIIGGVLLAAVLLSGTILLVVSRRKKRDVERTALPLE